MHAAARSSTAPYVSPWCSHAIVRCLLGIFVLVVWTCAIWAGVDVSARELRVKVLARARDEFDAIVADASN